VSGLPVELLQFSAFRTVLAALFCGSLFLAVCSLVLGCGRRLLMRRRRLRRERKLRQQSKQQRCNDVRNHLMASERRQTIADEPSRTETPAPLGGCAVSSGSHNVCHCLPRTLRRKSPATAVVRRGRSIESLPIDQRSIELVPPRLTHASSLAVLQRPESTGSRPDLVRMSAFDDGCTSGAERWKPITVAGETTFPVQPSAAVFLSLDIDDSVRYQRRYPQEI